MRLSLNFLKRIGDLLSMSAKKILVIEDEPSIADGIVYALETEGFQVTWKSKGLEGMQAFKEDGADLILLDVGLPDSNGFELCKEIRTLSNVPVVFLTARREEVDCVVGLEIGADDYVSKPFSPRELSARIKSILRRTQGSPEETTPSSSGPFAVDAERFLITYYGEKLDLSRYEYRLLKVLIDRPGKVYSRDQLMEIVWDDAGASLDRTVDAHIKSLRSKLKAVKGSLDPIMTHRGIGYSLKDDL